MGVGVWWGVLGGGGGGGGGIQCAYNIPYFLIVCSACCCHRMDEIGYMSNEHGVQ